MRIEQQRLVDNGFRNNIHNNISDGLVGLLRQLDGGFLFGEPQNRQEQLSNLFGDTFRGVGYGDGVNTRVLIAFLGVLQNNDFFVDPGDRRPVTTHQVEESYLKLCEECKIEDSATIKSDCGEITEEFVEELNSTLSNIFAKLPYILFPSHASKESKTEQDNTTIVNVDFKPTEHKKSPKDEKTLLEKENAERNSKALIHPKKGLELHHSSHDKIRSGDSNSINFMNKEENLLPEQ